MSFEDVVEPTVKKVGDGGGESKYGTKMPSF